MSNFEMFETSSSQRFQLPLAVQPDSGYANGVDGGRLIAEKHICGDGIAADLHCSGDPNYGAIDQAAAACGRRRIGLALEIAQLHICAARSSL